MPTYVNGNYFVPFDLHRCCEVHDKCYDDIVDSGTCGWFSKITIYGIFYYTKDCTGCGKLSNIL